MKYYRKHDVMMAIDKENNYSVVSRDDPEPDGYVDHRWEEEDDQWAEITVVEYDDTLRDWQTVMHKYNTTE